MNSLIERLMGVDSLTDQVIAMDMLTAAKTGITMYAVAATEAATMEMKATFERHLHESIETHAKLTDYVVSKGWYRPYDVQEQLRLNQQNAKTALSLPS